MSLPYFRENGWEPVILAVEATSVEGLSDPLLADTVPADITVHRVRALPARLTRVVGLGNLAYRAWFQLSAAGARLLRGARFDLVYFSTTQFVVTVLGPRWRQQSGVPYIIDIQDPWRTDYYERSRALRPPGGWKYRFAHWQATRLEERAWRDAAGFISVSTPYLAQLQARYRWFAQKPAVVIPFGASEADFDFVRAHNEIEPVFEREPGALHLVSVGAIASNMRGSLARLFAEVRALRTTGAATRLRFHFIGTSYAPEGRGMPVVAPLAAEFGIGDLVLEQPERVPYFVALKTMLAADAIILPGSDDLAYHPSKIATCFLAERPLLAIARSGSALERTVRELNFSVVACFPKPEGDETILSFLRDLLAGRSASPANRASDLFRTAYTARARTQQQCDFFSSALKSPPR